MRRRQVVLDLAGLHCARCVATVERALERIPGVRSAAVNLALEQGRTPLLVARGGEFLGVIVVADALRESSREAVSQLRSLGLDVQLLSGDHPAAVQAIAHEAGIQHFQSQVLPSDKAAVVERLRSAGQIVAMAGDGINDAPALAAADLGITVGGGADIALEAADVVLIGGDLRKTAELIRLSRATLRIIKQNLLWACVYNAALLPLAAGIFIPSYGVALPASWAAFAMAASSLSVVGNSLRLR